jgi:preprotein translocase subunit Sss1
MRQADIARRGREEFLKELERIRNAARPPHREEVIGAHSEQGQAQLGMSER